MMMTIPFMPLTGRRTHRCIGLASIVVKNLIQAGADASLLNSHKHSPIDEAVSRGKLDAINTAAAQLELMRAAVSYWVLF
ncbi:hypothetical protein MLD38_003424 [Melastoma candidum]|uniref:Uncharacterized protein n=1 Tax=Melastoma candidum TaxID=119954 RepID=A0ACB9S2E3_9MYRT|nr:hypothetical protein MLD38_003424 [Melastoma candidum]